MKKILLAAASMVGIIVVRMILSIIFNDQVAEIFCSISIGFLFYYSICCLLKNKMKTAQMKTEN